MVQDLSFENHELKSVIEGDSSILEHGTPLHHRILNEPNIINAPSTPKNYGLQSNRFSTPSNNIFGTPDNRVKPQMPATTYNMRTRFELSSPVIRNLSYSQPRTKMMHSRTGSTSPTPNILHIENQQMESKELLEKQMATLLSKQKELNFELVRIPTSGHKSKLRMEVTEEKLEDVERQMASIKRKMKQQGFF